MHKQWPEAKCNRLETTAEASSITVVITRRSHVNSFEKETGRVTTSHLVNTHHSPTRRVVSKVAALVSHIPLVSGTDNCVSELETLQTVPCTIKPARAGRLAVQLITGICQGEKAFDDASCFFNLLVHFDDTLIGSPTGLKAQGDQKAQMQTASRLKPVSLRDRDDASYPFNSLAQIDNTLIESPTSLKARGDQEAQMRAASRLKP